MGEKEERRQETDLALGGVALEGGLEGTITKGAGQGELTVNTTELNHATGGNDAVALLEGFRQGRKEERGRGERRKEEELRTASSVGLWSSVRAMVS